MTPDQLLSDIGERLADDIERELGPWIERSVAMIFEAWQGTVPEEVAADARAAGRNATAELMPKMRELLASDVDDQWTNPLQLIRGSVEHATSVLERHGVPEVVRDEFAERTAPSDAYGLEPAGFVDIHPALHEVGLAWGASKANAHIARRKIG